MDKFTASNGVSIMISIEDPHDALVRIVFEDEGGRSLRRLNADELSALREFFAHERDVELGRWRWSENPDYVVYPSALYLTPPDADLVTVFNERTGASMRCDRADEGTHGHFSLAARTYFAAHPEPKPWHDAKPGEVWVVSAYEEPIAMTVFESDFGGLRFRQNDREGTIWAIDTPVITSARRIYPEVSDD